MQLPSILSALLVTANVAMAQSNGTLPVRLISWNIRYAATSREANEQPWSTRKSLVVGIVADKVAQAPAGAVPVIGMQEVLAAQLDDIKTGLGDGWDHIGVGRDDGVAEGEFNPILYQPAVLKLVWSEVKWLSPTPDEPSFGWGAGSRRVIVLAVFEHSATGRRFLATNTHLDNASAEARREGVKVALGRIRAAQDAYGPLPVSLTGDFNSAPGEDAYSTVVDDGYLAELYETAAASQRFGPYDTYTGFSPTTTGSRIDFIWLGPVADNKWTVDRYEAIDNVVDGVYASDHRAVMGDLQLVA